jgi:hypothetical protein
MAKIIALCDNFAVPSSTVDDRTSGCNFAIAGKGCFNEKGGHLDSFDRVRIHLTKCI